MGNGWSICSRKQLVPPLITLSLFIIYGYFIFSNLLEGEKNIKG